MRSEATGPQPIPIKDGEWWICSRLMRFTCPACVGVMFDRPAVMAYLKSRDPDGKERRFGNYVWVRLGWLIWIECPLCGWTSMDGGPEQQRACGDALVIQWSHKGGPWRWLDDDPGPKAEAAREVQGRQPIPDSLRGYIYERDGYRCVDCGAGTDLAIDHIFAVSKGGSNDISNLRVLCRPCNSRKGAKILKV